MAAINTCYRTHMECVCVFVRAFRCSRGAHALRPSTHGKRIDDNKLCPLTWPSMLHCCQCRAAASLYYYWRANCSASECARRVRKLSNPGARQRFKLCIPKHTHTHTRGQTRACACAIRRDLYFGQDVDRVWDPFVGLTGVVVQRFPLHLGAH